MNWKISAAVYYIEDHTVPLMELGVSDSIFMLELEDFFCVVDFLHKFCDSKKMNEITSDNPGLPRLISLLEEKSSSAQI